MRQRHRDSSPQADGDEKDGQDEGEQEQPEADDHPHGRHPRPPCPAQSKLTLGVVLGGSPHRRPLADRCQDEEHDHQQQPEDRQQDDQRHMFGNPGRDLLLDGGEVGRSASASGRLGVVEAEAAAALAREQGNQPQVFVVPADPERAHDDIPVRHV